MTKPVNIDFCALRERQNAIVSEANWMLREIDANLIEKAVEDSRLLEARELVVALRQVGQDYLNEEILTLKAIALAQRDSATQHRPDPSPPIQRLLERLRSSVELLHGMIGRLGDRHGEQRLTMLLRTGMIGVLQAVDSIANELAPLLTRNKGTGRSVLGMDFGVYDPATD